MHLISYYSFYIYRCCKYDILTKDSTVHCQMELLIRVSLIAPFRWAIQNLHACWNENFCKTEHFHCSCRCSFCTTTPPVENNTKLMVQFCTVLVARPTCGDTALRTLTIQCFARHVEELECMLCRWILSKCMLYTGWYKQNVFCQMYIKCILYTVGYWQNVFCTHLQVDIGASHNRRHSSTPSIRGAHLVIGSSWSD